MSRCRIRFAAWRLHASRSPALDEGTSGTSGRTGAILRALGAERRWCFGLRRKDPTPVVSFGGAHDSLGAGRPRLSVSGIAAARISCYSIGGGTHNLFTSGCGIRSRQTFEIPPLLGETVMAWLFFVVLLAVPLGWYVYSKQVQEEEDRKRHLRRLRLKGDEVRQVKEKLAAAASAISDEFVSPTRRSAIALDDGLDEPRLLVLGEREYGQRGPIEVSVLRAEDIRAVEAKLDEQSVTRVDSNDASLVARAAVGGALFGEVGALAGALSGSKTQWEDRRIATAALVIRVDDVANPLRTVTFFAAAQPVPLGDARGALAVMEKWLARLAVLIERGGGKARP